MENEDPKVSVSLIDYYESIQRFRRRLEILGCPICDGSIKTRKTKFHFIEWDRWRCNDLKEISCEMATEWHDVYDSFAEFGKESR